jgi:hypothetical protein
LRGSSGGAASISAAAACPAAASSGATIDGLGLNRFRRLDTLADRSRPSANWSIDAGKGAMVRSAEALLLAADPMVRGRLKDCGDVAENARAGGTGVAGASAAGVSSETRSKDSMEFKMPLCRRAAILAWWALSWRALLIKRGGEGLVGVAGAGNSTSGRLLQEG